MKKRGAGGRVGEDHRLAEERPALGAADVERIAQPREVGQAHVVGAAGESVGEARAVDVQPHAELIARPAHLLELGARVERAVLGGLREVDHAGLHHMVAVAVVCPRGGRPAHLCGRQLPELAIKLDHLVAASLDRPGFVHAHVPALRGHDALPGSEQRVDDHHVGLRATHQEVDVGLRASARLSDELACPRAGVVRPVPRVLTSGPLGQLGHDSRVAPLLVVRCE